MTRTAPLLLVTLCCIAVALLVACSESAPTPTVTPGLTSAQATPNIEAPTARTAAAPTHTPTAELTLTPTATPLETLKNTEAAPVKVSTYRYTMDAWQTPQLEGDTDYKTFSEFTVVVGEGMHVITRMEGGGYHESLLLDGVQHFRNGPNEAWQTSYSSFDPSTMPLLEPHENFNLYSDLIDVRVLGEEQVNGVPATKVRGNINMQSKVEKIWGNPETQSPELSAGSEDPRGQFLAGSEEFTGWVGINDGLLHAYELHGSYPAFGELLQFEYSLRAEYFDFNEPLVLPTP